jgi:hypothetical protein
LDITLPAVLNVASADAAVGHRVAEAVFAAGGVAAIYGVNDFVTVTREPGFEWDPIVAAVVAAAERDRSPADRSRYTSPAVTYVQQHSTTMVGPNHDIHVVAARPEWQVGNRLTQRCRHRRGIEQVCSEPIRSRRSSTALRDVAALR